MIALYVMQINKGKMILEQVPKRWYDAVKEALYNKEAQEP
jgi:hypothetical protein